MRSRLPTLVALVLVACGGSDDAPIDAGPSTDAGAPDCSALSAPTVLGTIDDPRVHALSGLAASRRHSGLFYAHDESDEEPRVYVVDDRARVVATISLRGAAHVDWEDIAVGPGPDGMPWVFVGDVGDEAASSGGRADVVVYRFPEPPSAPSGEIGVVFESPRFEYPDLPRDCEAIFVDPAGDLFLLAKERWGAAGLYRARSQGAGSNALELVATTTLRPGSAHATAADLSPSGASLLVRTLEGLHLFTRAPDEPWADVLARAPTRVPVQPETQGEAVAWLADGRGYVTAPQGASPPLARVDALDPRCAF